MAYIKKKHVDKETKAPLPYSKLTVCFLTDPYALLPSLEMYKYAFDATQSSLTKC